MGEVMYNPHFLPFFECEMRYAVLWGSAGSAKSYSAAQKIVERCTHSNERHKFLVVRKFKTTIEGSVFTLIKHIISEFGIDSHVTINNTKMTFTFSNGNEIITTGLDDVEKLKSIHGVTGVWLEECTELEQADLGQLNLRLRGISDSYKQIILTFNPVSEDHWIKKRFFDEGGANVFTLWSNYKHNLFLDAEYVELLETEYEYDPNMHRIYVQGLWGKIRFGEEYYAQFSRDRNVKYVVYNPESPIHQAWDFNVSPYLPMSMWQIDNREGIYVVSCFGLYALENPRNTTESVCDAFIEDYPNTDVGIFVYGDVSGRARDTRSKVHDYDIIENKLSKYIRNWSMRVPKRNPFSDKRRDFVNKCLAGGYSDIAVVIDPTCDLLITDLENVYEDGAGHKVKKKFKNAAGVQYEKYGHFSDTMDYLLCSLFFERYRDFGRKLK